MEDTIRQPKGLQLLQSNISPMKYENEGGEYLSVYCDTSMKVSDWKEGVKQLRAAFPKLEDAWFDLLTTKMKEKKFTQQQFHDAIDNVITNCKYPTPQIADLLNYQKGVRLITRERFLQETKDETPLFKSNFLAIDVDGQLFYANKNELLRNKIPYKLWQKDATTQTIQNQTMSNNDSLSKSLNILEEFDRIVKESEADPLYRELQAAKKEAQMNFGVNAVIYDKAMKKIEFLQNKLRIA
jgi:hypothetical protein